MLFALTCFTDSTIFSNLEINKFKDLVPKFFGFHENNQIIKGKKSIILENLLENKTNASIIDIKIGKKNYLDSVSEIKKLNG